MSLRIRRFVHKAACVVGRLTAVYRLTAMASTPNSDVHATWNESTATTSTWYA